MPDKNLRSLQPHDLIQLLEGVPVPLFVKNTQGHVIYANRTWRQSMAPALGGSPAAAVSDVLSAEQLASFHQRDLEAFSAGTTVTHEDEVKGNGQHKRTPYPDHVGSPF